METKVAIEMIGEKRYTTDEPKSSKIYEWQKANGTIRAKKLICSCYRILL